MGLDIKLWIERKVNDKWELLDIDRKLLPQDRSYKVFAFLFGIRNKDYNEDWKGVIPHRDYPTDASRPLSEASETFCAYACAYVGEILDAPWEETDLEDHYFYIFFIYVLPRLVNWWHGYNYEDRENIRILAEFSY